MLPRHIAIIMDGNGRWASARGLPRVAGHRAGVETLRRIVQHAATLKLEWLTLYAFSSENWSRPASEIAHLIGLLRLFIQHDLDILNKNNVKIRIIGARENLNHDINALLNKAEDVTFTNNGLNLVIAFNYGARDEIVRATRAMGAAISGGTLDPTTINEETFATYLDTAGQPDPDLIIRTSGEMRLSNFLLWQAAYAELCFVPCPWPDFSITDFDKIIADFFCRERRFGALKDKS